MGASGCGGHPSPTTWTTSRRGRLSLDNPWLTVETLLVLEPGRAFSTAARARKFLFSPKLEDEAVRRYVALLGRESFRAILELGYLRPDPARVRGTPLLVLGAERDYIIPPSEITRTAQAYGAESQVLPDIAHDMMLDPDWRRAADAMLAWLTATLDARPA